MKDDLKNQDFIGRYQEQDSEESRISINSGDMLEAMQDVEKHLEEGGMDEFYEENLKRIKDKKKQKREQKKVGRLEILKVKKLQKLHEVGEDDPRKITYVKLKRDIESYFNEEEKRQQNQQFKSKKKLKYEKALYKLKSQNKYIKKQIVTFFQVLLLLIGEGAIKTGIIKGVKLQ
ncbi:unnamed protein product (macronuclear) [Paramecium tetraurelia]|uniref:Ribosomal RNA-processing protein 36 n=1 Tax=Paramecium tetraurelia TaxID=5888 RepID=A0E8R6_PARTE|nr:uncharacterized protein GSPATT00024412001 [Paramecium tetraurelia]CAK91683.1 unnamed protein product [Paramecium tetraurelia]|eukprot:XP_001459080.1 hypothetical protein (macronuclear) [Paramecium tetraurelia strain d4-2]